MANKNWRKLDFLLIGAFLVLCVIGCIEVYYSTQINGYSPYFWKQLLRMAMGVILFLFILLPDYRKWLNHINIFYVAGNLVLVYVLFFGVVIHSSKSWIRFGSINVQPSEIVKLLIILTLARYFSEHTERYLGPLQLLVSGMIMFVPVGLIIAQHDLGTAITIIPVYFAMIAIAGLKKKVVISSMILFVLILGGSWFLLKDYQKARIESVLNPQKDPSGTGYQTIQSVIAVGSGGFLGRGLGQGSQGALGFLPERHTDFIFSVIAEELGFLGAIIVLSCYGVIFFRGLKIGYESFDKTAMYSCLGIVTLYTVHLSINVGMAIGLLPVIGIPLPPLSYGGSSLISAFIALGLLNNFLIHRSFV